MADVDMNARDAGGPRSPVAEDVAKVVDHLRAGRTSRAQATEVKTAAERALADRAASEATGRLS